MYTRKEDVMRVIQNRSTYINVVEDKSKLRSKIAAETAAFLKKKKIVNIPFGVGTDTVFPTYNGPTHPKRRKSNG
jgi:hypothetical protein